MSVQPIELTPGIVLGAPGALPLIAGPCVIEGTDWLVARGRAMKEMADRLDAQIVFKSSYDKANRSSLASFRGPGLEKGLEALAAVKAETTLPVLTDVHAPDHCERVAAVCDVLQVPAFLCRQTDLVTEAARQGKPVLIKKGQFMAPDEMRRVVDKARQQGNERIGVTERGTTFGYHNLVVDMRSYEMMKADGIPVLHDVTHSLQLPGARQDDTGGLRQYAEPLTRAAVAAGAQGLYMEVHPEPDSALCDSATQLPPDRAEALVRDALAIRKIVAPR